MTLNQAIDRYANNAEYERRNGSLQGCLEFRQLAEWLKDYKRLLEQEAILDKIRSEIKEMTPTYHNSDWSITDLVPISEVIDVVDKYKAESEE